MILHSGHVQLLQNTASHAPTLLPLSSPAVVALLRPEVPATMGKE